VESRPPIGKLAMSSTERARRRRSRLPTEREEEPKPAVTFRNSGRATKAMPHDAAKDKRIAKLARIAEVEHERDRYKQTAESGGNDCIAELENAVKRAKKRAWEAERRAKAKTQREAKSAALRKAAAERKAKREAAKRERASS
jgi:colicin import membrane protein